VLAGSTAGEVIEPMPDPLYLLAAVLVATTLTWMLRAAPFAVLAPLRDSELVR
jgi:branched-subunit amino acid transport protein AzlD